MKITPTTLTITELLSSESLRFVVPAYQRRYSWGIKQVTEFFDDIDKLENNEAHLLGSIVCLTKYFQAGINDLELVDGQQRMTTIMLFINAMEERLLKLGKEEDARDIQKFLYCKDLKGNRSNKLVLGDLDESDFKHVMDNTNLDKIVNPKLREAHEKICKIIDGLTDEKFLEFKYRFTNNAQIIRLDVAEAKDAFKLFETINNRGLSLSPADIIKNFLLGNASLISDEVLENVKKDWTAVIVALDNIDMDDFFRQHVITLRGRRVSQTMLIDTFKKYYAKNITEGELLKEYVEFADDDEEQIGEKLSIAEFVEDLRKSAEVYQKIIRGGFGDKKLDRHMRNLKKIRSIPSYIFILSLMRRQNVSYEDKLEILWMTEVFTVRRNIAEYRTNELEDIFAKMTRLADIDLIDAVREEYVNNIPSDSEFKDKLQMYQFKGQAENRAKYILEYIEYYIENGARTFKTPEKYVEDENIHLEHIMPQKIEYKYVKDQLGDWVTYLGDNAIEKHRDNLWRIGNLTLLGAPLNIHASNNPFKSKKSDGIADDTKSKEPDYEASTIKITRELLEYDDFRFEQIDERSERLSKLAAKIWKI